MAEEKNLESKKSSKKGQTKPKPSKVKAEPVKVQEEVEVLETEAPQTISLFLAVGLIIGALVVGLVIGFLAAPKGSSNNDFVIPGATNAPALTPEQLKQGQLPAGHPQVPGLGAPETSPTTEQPSAEQPAPAKESQKESKNTGKK